MDHEEREAIAARLKRFRLSKQITQQELALRIGLEKEKGGQRITQWEGNINGVPSYLLAQLEDALEVHRGALLGAPEPTKLDLMLRGEEREARNILTLLANMFQSVTEKMAIIAILIRELEGVLDKKDSDDVDSNNPKF